MVTRFEGAIERAGMQFAVAFRTALERSKHPGYHPLAGGGAMVITGLQHPLANCGLGMQDDEVEDVIRELVLSNYPSMLTFTSKLPSPCEDLAEAAGFSMSPVTPTMVVDIHQLTIPEMPLGYEFRRIAAHESGEGWNIAVGSAFNIPDELCEIMGPGRVTRSDDPRESIHYYEIVWNGTTVAGSMMILDGEVAGIYCVGTTEVHRGRGLGAIVTGLPLLDAQKIGYRFGVLQASRMGLPVYERLGFQRVGEIRNYFRLPE